MESAEATAEPVEARGPGPSPSTTGETVQPPDTGTGATLNLNELPPGVLEAQPVGSVLHKGTLNGHSYAPHGAAESTTPLPPHPSLIKVAAAAPSATTAYTTARETLSSVSSLDHTPELPPSNPRPAARRSPQMSHSASADGQHSDAAAVLAMAQNGTAAAADGVDHSTLEEALPRSSAATGPEQPRQPPAQESPAVEPLLSSDNENVSGSQQTHVVEASSRSGSDGVDVPGPSERSLANLNIAETSTRGDTAGKEASPDAQDDTSSDWRQQRKHMFVLTHAGKPVWARHGDRSALAGFMAVLQALMSFVKDKGDVLRSIRAGRHVVVFEERGPLYLVAAAATGEPAGALRLQLSLLHAQIMAILTNAVDRMFLRNPRYDAAGLLEGTAVVLRRLGESFEHEPAALLAAFAPLPLPSHSRQVAVHALQAAIKEGGAMYGVLLGGDGVVAVAQPKASPLHPHDLLLLLNFVRANESFQQAEAMSPVCLPHFNAAAFLHAYIAYLDAEAGLALVLLCAQADAFFRLAAARQQLEATLTSFKVIQAVRAAVGLGGEVGAAVRIETLPLAAGGGGLGTAPLLHFIYHSPARRQYLCPQLTPLTARPGAIQDLMAAYARVHLAMFGEQSQAAAGLPAASTAAGALQRVHFEGSDERVLLAYVGPEYVIYGAFDPVTDKATALQVCSRLCTYIKGRQAEVFVPF